MGDLGTKMVQSISDDELKDMNLNKKKYLEMVKFNRKTVLQIHDQLPGELIEDQY